MLYFLLKCFTFFYDHAGKAQRATVIITPTIVATVIVWGMPIFREGGIAPTVMAFVEQHQPNEAFPHRPDPTYRPTLQDVLDYYRPLGDELLRMPLAPTLPRIGVMAMAAVLSIQTGRMFFPYLLRTIPNNTDYNPSPLLLIVGLARFFIEPMFLAPISLLPWLPIPIALVGVALGNWLIIGTGLVLLLCVWTFLLPKKDRHDETTHERGSQFADYRRAQKRERSVINH